MKKAILGIFLLVFGAILIAGCAQQAKAPAQQTKAPAAGEISVTTKHGELTLEQIAEIQPGLGTVMIEYGTRFHRMYKAAKAGEWDLAKYQLKEAREIQEVGEITRPGKADMLKSFESTYLDSLDKAIEAKDWNSFETAYNKAVDGCNGCHAATGHPYIKYPDAMPTTVLAEKTWKIQPGLGTVMIEYGTRYYRMYYAAKAGKWDLAKYQLKEAREIQEVGEITRPGKAAMLKSFEDSYLDPIDKAIEAKDWNSFETAYNKGVDGCNGCHAATGHPYIKYVTPATPPEMPETVTTK